MKKFFCTVAFACLIITAGCSQNSTNQDNTTANLFSQLQEDASDAAVLVSGTDHEEELQVDTAPVTVTVSSFVSGMGCSDPACTDASHHHDCPPDCEDYEHHHTCDLDCTEASHHHANTYHEEEHHADTMTAAAVSFVSGMGCSDPSCTDASHHHDCPPDCEDYEHHHTCDLDCTEASHHHVGTSSVSESGQHHTEQRHGSNHH